MSRSVPFVDLQAQYQRLKPEIDSAIAQVLEGGQFILGPQVTELEGRLAAFCGARHAVTCANGTDALVLALRVLGIGAGDAVIVPAFTFVATAEAVVLAGAVPVFCDVEPDTFTLCPASLEAAVAEARNVGLSPRAAIPVDLFGQPADYHALEPLAASLELALICDSAQGFGGSLDGRRAGTFGRLTTTSFFPAKPLGCYGDGGAVFTDDDDLAEMLRSLRMHGKGRDKYDNVRIGTNSRLDTLQAAILLPKLAVFPDELEAREAVAARYDAALSDGFRTPVLRAGARSAWAQYTLVADDRDRLADACGRAGVPTALYYPVPLDRQPGYRHFPGVPTPTSQHLADRVLSLPMHPYLEPAEQDRIVAALLAA